MEQALFVPFLELFEAFAQGDKLRIVFVPAQPGDELDLDFLGFLVRLFGIEQSFENLGVHHQGVQIVAHRLHMHVLVHQLDGLGPQGVPEQFAVATRWFHRLIHLSQPLVVLFIGAETGTGRQRLPQVSEYRVLGRELVPGLVIRQAIFRRDQPLVAADGAVHARKER